MEVTEKRPEAAGPSATRERHRLAVRLDRFGWQALEAAARGHHESIESLIADACGYFAVEAEVGRAATRLPRFRDHDGKGEPRELELHMPSRIWQVLQQEAERQGAQLPRVVEHASLLYLADLDSGRAVRRILDAEEGD